MTAVRQTRLPLDRSVRLLTIDETAARLSVSIRNVRHQIYLRRLPIVKIGRLVRVDERDLEAFIESGRVDWDRGSKL